MFLYQKREIKLFSFNFFVLSVHHQIRIHFRFLILFRREQKQNLTLFNKFLNWMKSWKKKKIGIEENEMSSGVNIFSFSHLFVQCSLRLPPKIIIMLLMFLYIYLLWEKPLVLFFFYFFVKTDFLMIVQRESKE